MFSQFWEIDLGRGSLPKSANTHRRVMKAEIDNVTFSFQFKI